MKTFLEYVKSNGVKKPAVIASCVLAVILGFAHTPLFFTLSFLIAAMTFIPTFKEMIMIKFNNSDNVIKCAVIGLFVFSLLLGPGAFTMFFMQTLALLLINFIPPLFQLLPSTVKERLPVPIASFLGVDGFSGAAGASNQQEAVAQEEGQDYQFFHRS